MSETGSSTKHEFEEVARIEDPDGLVAIITSRVKHNGRKAYSFMFAKMYDKNGETHSTVWLGPQHVEAVRRLADKVDRQVELLEDRDRMAARQGGVNGSSGIWRDE